MRASSLVCKSIRSNRCKNYAILPHQKFTLLFYHIILQYPIYQMFYIFTTSFKYYFLILFNSYFILSLLFVPNDNICSYNSHIFKSHQF